MSQDLLDSSTELDDTKPQKRVKEYDDNGNLLVKFSATKTATLKELDGYQSLKADAMVGVTASPLVILKLYALFGLQSLTDGGMAVTLPPTNNDQNVYRRAKLFTSRELTILMAEYADEYMPEPESAEELKN